ncbi:MAG: 5'/3'-nucleotidase SurE, partial [Pseudomonadota bacterium]
MALNILLTNDDSHDSPLFHFAIEALASLGELTISVPAAEQSWQGKAMTRFGNIYAERINIHGVDVWSVSGTPADCVNLAIYQLLDQKPDIVVSGPNIGKNTGLSFMFSSGTVGACLEANIAGIPALALSQELKPEQFFQWGEKRAFDTETTTLPPLNDDGFLVPTESLELEEVEISSSAMLDVEAAST